MTVAQKPTELINAKSKIGLAAAATAIAAFQYLLTSLE